MSINAKSRRKSISSPNNAAMAWVSALQPM
jgi:hypothetical protein